MISTNVEFRRLRPRQLACGVERQILSGLLAAPTGLAVVLPGFPRTGGQPPELQPRRSKQTGRVQRAHSDFAELLVFQQAKRREVHQQGELWAEGATHSLSGTVR